MSCLALSELPAAERTIPTSIGPRTPTQIVDELTYSSFAAHRDAGMSADAYGQMLRRDMTAFEARYQAETEFKQANLRG